MHFIFRLFFVALRKNQSNSIHLSILRRIYQQNNRSLLCSSMRTIHYDPKRIKWNSYLKSSFLLPQNIHHITILWKSYQPLNKEKNRNMAMYLTSLVILILGLSYAAVPLYRIYCQKTGTGLQARARIDELNEKVAKMQKVENRKIRVIFDAEKSSRLAWNFKPSQKSVICSPGETVLAFYRAKNMLDRPVNGIATYTILPYEAGKYFNKIQCFCFEEQQLNANEEVDLPVFFFIDPEYARDPYLFDYNEIILSYNFFETKEGYKFPQPPGVRAHYPLMNNKEKSDAKITSTN